MNSTNVQPIVLKLSPEVQELLVDNQIDLVTELQDMYPEEKIKRDHSHSVKLTEEDEPEKSVELIILASATAFALVSIGIEKIIHALQDGKKVVTKKVEDKNSSKFSFLGLSVAFENERKQG